MQFATVGPTVQFMLMMHKWFAVIDVINSQRHIHKNDPKSWHFSDVDDASLKWLETTFLGYIASLKNESHPENFFSKETSHALVLVTITNVECVCFLLRKKKINYVLIWKFSSNPIEVLFGFLRRTAGCNDAMNDKSVQGWLERLLETGIVSTSMQSKVKCSTSLSSAIANSSDDIQNGGRPVKGFFPPTAGERLRELCMTSSQ